jgi:hypothetical protein
MPTSQPQSMLYELEHKLPIPLEKRAYFHARVLNSFYQYVLLKFMEEERAGRLTKAELGRRIERAPAVISRLLGAPGNWGLETVTDLLLGICGEELVPSSTPLVGRAFRNYQHWEAQANAPIPPTTSTSTTGVFNIPSRIASVAA